MARPGIQKPQPFTKCTARPRKQADLQSIARARLIAATSEVLSAKFVSDEDLIDAAQSEGVYRPRTAGDSCSCFEVTTVSPF